MHIYIHQDSRIVSHEAKKEQAILDEQVSTSHCEFNGTHLCAHAQKTFPCHQFIHSLCPYSFTQSLWTSFSLVFSMHLINHFLPSITHFFIFIIHFYMGLHEPWKFFLKFSYTCLSNNSLIS